MNYKKYKGHGCFRVTLEGREKKNVSVTERSRSAICSIRLRSPINASEVISPDMCEGERRFIVLYRRRVKGSIKSICRNTTWDNNGNESNVADCGRMGGRGIRRYQGYRGLARARS